MGSMFEIVRGSLDSTSETVDTGPVDVEPIDDHQRSEENKMTMNP